jgi:hypothetical protein
MSDSPASSRAVRVVLVYDPDPMSEPYSFDVMLDGAGRIADAAYVYGVCGDYPAVLKSDGVIDFGPAMDAASRYYRTDLRTQAMTPGTQVVVRDAENQPWIYRVESVTPR